MKRIAAISLTLVLALAGCGGDDDDGNGNGGNGGGGSGETAAPAQEEGNVSASVVKAWPKKWCAAKIGDDRDRLRKLMGEPTDELTAKDAKKAKGEDGKGGAQPFMAWASSGYRFVATFDENDTVGRLDIDPAKLTKEQKEGIPCSDRKVGDEEGTEAERKAKGKGEKPEGESAE